MCCGLWFRVPGGQSAEEKLSVRDRSSAHQPITGNNLLWTLRRILRASSAADYNCCVILGFFSVWVPPVNQKNTSEVGFCSRCVTEIPKVKQRLSAVAYFGGSWLEAHAHDFCGRDGSVNAYFETRTQVDGRDQRLAVEGLYVPPQNKRCTLRQWRGVRGPDLTEQQDLKPVC